MLSEQDEALAEAVAAVFRRVGERERWHKDALCSEPTYQAVEFVPARGEDSRPAKALCAQCLVRAECLAYALAQPLPFYGIWGGLSERERRRVRRDRALAE